MKHFFNSYIVLLLFICPAWSMEVEPMKKSKPHSIMYAPWREQYANKTHNTSSQPTHVCVFCTMHQHDDNNNHHILHRGAHSFIKLSSQPYVNNGIHFLIVSYEHKREIGDLSEQTYKEINAFTQKLCTLFSSDCNEIYININQGTSAGASIPDHHHKHLIFNKSPRYYNLIKAIKATKTTINLNELFQSLQPTFVDFDKVTIPPTISTECKQCYYCSILKDTKNSQKNLIIHRGKKASIMLSHYPIYFGEIDIIPHDHIDALEQISTETYEEINDLTRLMYPLLLKHLNTQDCNMGTISYGGKATDQEHIKQKIIPRKSTWNTTSTTRAYHFNSNIINFYHKLLEEWKNSRAKL